MKARTDMKSLGIKADSPSRYSTYMLPLIKQQKITFDNMLKCVKVPNGHGSNICRCVSSSIFRLKGHDYHILMQQLPYKILRHES